MLLSIQRLARGFQLHIGRAVQLSPAARASLAESRTVLLFYYSVYPIDDDGAETCIDGSNDRFDLWSCIDVSISNAAPR